jgi:hypothetical protein
MSNVSGVRNPNGFDLFSYAAMDKPAETEMERMSVTGNPG